MTKILYRANPPSRPNGPLEANFVEAETEKEAVEKLKAQGCTDIMLYEFAAMARLHNKERDKLKPSAAKVLASANIDSIMKRPSWRTFSKMLWRCSKGYLLLFAVVCIVYVAWGGRSRWPLVGGGIGGLIGICYGVFSPGRAMMDMARLNEASAHGDWPAVRRLSKRLRHSKALQKVSNGLFYLDGKLAYAEIAEAGPTALEHLPIVLERLETWRDKVPLPGLYESLLANLYRKVGDYPAYVAMMRQAYEVSQSDLMILGDWVLAEARLGDTATAARLLQKIDAEFLPGPARPFYPWIMGTIALRENRTDEALAHLRTAVNGFLVYHKNPATWTSFAICAGDCALALARSGENNQAKELAESVWLILEAHGDQPLLTMLKREVME